MIELAPAFLADILEHPEDDTPRLVYADWLEDAGDSARAEFIRAQINRATCCWRNVECYHCDHLRAYERNLLTANDSGGTWATPVAAALGLYDWCHEGGTKADTGPVWTWQRGFIHRITLPLQSWLDHGAALVAVAPLERVEVTDRRPMQGTHANAHALWFDETVPGEATYATLPCELASLLVPDPEEAKRGQGFCGPKCWAYPTVAIATDALSHALLTLARGHADIIRRARPIVGDEIGTSERGVWFHWRFDTAENEEPGRVAWSGYCDLQEFLNAVGLEIVDMGSDNDTIWGHIVEHTAPAGG